MNDQLVICEGVTIFTLNPHNMALRNDYINNLLGTAFLVFPIVSKCLGYKTKIMIIRGFESSAYIRQELGRTSSAETYKHSCGFAVEFTWDGWTEEVMRYLALELYDKISEYVRIVFDTTKKSIQVSRDWPQSRLIEKTRNETRTIKEG